jgi:hypothetical protein|tara:strand:- start:235 stop:762 length:528 start_codon:yes stop_codon:yes gene_type:complete
MGRIAWFDAHARKLVKRASDLIQFNSNLKLLQTDLVANTWMHERYSCDGTQQQNRTSEYFEYPSTVAMLLREIRYGIRLDWRKVIVDPWPATEYNFHIGNVNVDYASLSLNISVPGASATTYEFHGVAASTKFVIATTGVGCSGSAASAATSDASGVLTFTAPAGVACAVTATAS